MITHKPYQLNSRRNEAIHSTNPAYINRTEFFINIFALCFLLMGFVGCLKDETAILVKDVKPVYERIGHKHIQSNQINTSDSIETEFIEQPKQLLETVDTGSLRNEILTIVQWSY